MNEVNKATSFSLLCYIFSLFFHVVQNEHLPTRKKEGNKRTHILLPFLIICNHLRRSSTPYNTTPHPNAIYVTINFVYKSLLWLSDGLDYFKPLVLDAAGAKSEGKIEFLNVEISEKVET